MDDVVKDTERYLEWYKNRARPFLEKLHPEKIIEYDQEVARLLASKRNCDEKVSICFLGNAGIGKSTLINALVAPGKRPVLPSGSVGSLTAQALSVQYADQPSFEVHYHTAGKLYGVIKTLEMKHRANLKAIGKLPTQFGESSSDLLDPDDGENIREQDADAPENRSMVDQYKKLAQLMIAGGQSAELELTYIVDSLREAIGKSRIWGTSSRVEDKARILDLQDALQRAKSDSVLRQAAAPDEPAFLKLVEHHACGHLAPLVKNMTVFWNADILKQRVELVDLPGVGVVGDAYREVTRKWIREKARGIVLVVGNRGVTEPDAELLRTSGFLNRLLHSAFDPVADPISLIVVAVRIDDSAETKWQSNRDHPKRQHLADLCSEFVPIIRAQVRKELESVWASSEQSVVQGRMDVIERVMQGLQIHPISAVQYHKFIANDEEDRSFITASEQSNVPHFVESLKTLAIEYRQTQLSRLNEVRDAFDARVFSTINLIKAQWEEKTRARDDSERLRNELLGFIEPLRKEFHVRQGAFREFLRVSMPQLIDAKVMEARVIARKSILAYLQKLQITHWSTLRAAVRRGGTYQGSRHVELPRDFALCFEEPIAEIWGREILKEIRKRTKEYADDCVELVEQVVGWARQQGSRVQPSLVEAQAEAIKSDGKTLVSVGREAVNELREQVKNNLIHAIEDTIRKKCKRFVDNNQDVGSGVKIRMLALFNELSEDATSAAGAVALKLLTQNYSAVEIDIRKIFDQYQDPLMLAANAIVATHEEREKRGDAQKRKAMLAEIEAVLSADPSARRLAS